MCLLTGANKVWMIRLPKSFVEKHEKNLSVSREYQQVKLRVTRQDGKFELGTAAGNREITEFVDPEPLVCKRTGYV